MSLWSFRILFLLLSAVASLPDDRLARAARKLLRSERPTLKHLKKLAKESSSTNSSSSSALLAAAAPFVPSLGAVSALHGCPCCCSSYRHCYCCCSATHLSHCLLLLTFSVLLPLLFSLLRYRRYKLPCYLWETACLSTSGLKMLAGPTSLRKLLQLLVLLSLRLLLLP